MKIICETERLILREFIPSDAEEILAMYSNLRLVEQTGDALMTRIDEAEAFINTIRNRQYKQGEIGILAVHEKKSGRFVGWLGIDKTQDAPMLDACLKTKFWNKGYATEAFRGLLAGIWASEAGTVFYATVDWQNPTALRVLEKLGYSIPIKNPTGNPTSNRLALSQKQFLHP